MKTLAAMLLLSLAASAQTVTVTATDSSTPPQTVTRTYMLAMQAAPAPPLVIATPALPPATMAVPYSAPLTFTGGTPPVSWTATGLPAGMTISAAGVISGTPTTGVITPPPAPGTLAPISLVGHAAAIGGTTPAFDTTGANFIAVCAPTRPTDSAGNIYALAYDQNHAGYIDSGLWVTFQPATSPNHTFTAGGNGLAVEAFAQVASGPDKAAGANTDPPVSTTGFVTPQNANELAISCYNLNNWQTQSPAPNITPPFTWTDAVLAPAFPFYATAMAYAVQTAPIPVQATWTSANTATNGNAQLIATFYGSLAPAILTATTTAAPEGFLGYPYSLQLTANGGVSPFTWTSSALPSGLTLTTGGLLSGTPASAVLATPVTFTVSDTLGHTAASVLPLTVASGALTLASTPCPPGKQLTAYAGCSLSATGGTPPYVFSASSDGSYSPLVFGLKVNAATGAIGGTVKGQGNSSSLLVVTDKSGATASLPIGFSIAGDNTFGGVQMFPANSIFHADISDPVKYPVDTSPAASLGPYLQSHLRLGFGTGQGIPILTVPFDQPMVAVSSDLGYFTSGPIPADAPMEGTPGVGDNHVLLVQAAGGGKPAALWEMYQNYLEPDGSWGGLGGGNGYGNVVWTDLTSNASLPQDRGSVDAAGLPIAPLLVNYDEVAAGEVTHPIRVSVTHMLNRYVWPGTAHAGVGSCSGGYVDDNKLIYQGAKAPTACTQGGPAGEMYRLKASVANPAKCTGAQATVILTGLRKHGIILADNGLPGFIMGTPDARWDDTQLGCLTALTLDNFEPVNVSAALIDLTTYKVAGTP